MNRHDQAQALESAVILLQSFSASPRRDASRARHNPLQSLATVVRLPQISNMQRDSRLGVMMLCLAIGACGSEEAPRIRQLECTSPAAGTNDGPIILLIDSGRKSVMFVNRASRPVRTAKIDEFSYQFGLPSDGKDADAEIGRMDGRMHVTRVGTKAAPAIDAWWTCKSVATGPRL